MSEQSSAPKEYSTQVREHYEMLPYPMRDWTKERETLYTSDHVSLDSINHEGWGGKRDLRKDGRFLIAGQGTGDATLFLAEQLRGSKAEIVSVDLSTASIEICKNRLAERGLDNVKVLHMSVLDLPNAGLGKFDFIDCCGVLHHLDDPLEGLKALEAVLADDGVMGLMVYAFYGRLPVYMLQILFQFMIQPDTHPLMKIEIAREFLKTLPKTHPMSYCLSGAFGHDLAEATGSGTYDLLLHSTDRAYTVPQLYEWTEAAGLVLGNFCYEWQGNMAYTPEVYTTSPLLRALLAEKPEAQRRAIAEIMSGSIIMHTFYTSKKPKTEAEFADDMVITLGFRQRLFGDFIPSLINGITPLQTGQQFEQPVTSLKAPSLIITKNPNTIALLNLLASEKPIGDIIKSVASQTGSPQEAVRKDFQQLYYELRSRRRVYLRHKDVPPYSQFMEIALRIKDIKPLKRSA